MDRILKADATLPPEVKSFKALATGAGVLDEATFRTIELDAMFDAINHCYSIAGQTALYRSLSQPSGALDDIVAKQQAVLELERNTELYHALQDLLKRICPSESALYELLYGSFLGMFGSSNDSLQLEGYGYQQYKVGTEFIVDFVRGVEQLPEAESPYLKELLAAVKRLSESRTYSLIAGPAYISESGVKSSAEKKPWQPAIRFKPTVFKPVLMLGLVLVLILLNSTSVLEWMGIASIARGLMLFLAIPLIMGYVPAVGSFDRDSCIYPLRNTFRESEDLHELIEILAGLDELVSIKQFAANFPSETVMPDLLSSAEHQVELTAAKNPLLGLADANYVGNDLHMSEQRLLLISGPNSGGKTAFCKTVAQIQVLAQIGSRVPAQSASLSVADHIFYQVPEFSSLSDGEGRFGSELKRTKDIFMQTSPASLVILDELSEGTTYEERLETAANVLDGFYRKGVSTILITHNHQLVEQMTGKGSGQAWQVEFKNELPTYKLVPGISKVSHAHRVAKKIGFSKEDIEGYLKG